MPEILNDYQISELVDALPSMIKMCDWELIYSLNRDGISMLTFFEKLVQDFQGTVFGGYCSEAWRVATGFYGMGENFLFTFKNGARPTLYKWTGNDDQFQYASRDAIGLGGGSRGRFGLFIKDSLYKGSSSKTNTFENDVLSTETDFVVALLEVWALV